jgi:phospholipid/cholesterol/gamma-HCH transport system substrate-binding protein
MELLSVESKVNYTIVGLFVVLLSAALIVAAIWLSGSDRKEYKTYLVYMHEAVSGLTLEAPVKFNGVDVGYVSSIQLDVNNPQQVRLLLNIDKAVPLNTSTTATLMAQGVTGLTYIGLKARSSQAPTLEAASGQKYPEIQSTPSLLVELDTAVRDVTTNIRSVTTIFNQVFDKQNQASITESLANLQKFSQTLADNSSRIDASIKNTSLILQNTAQASARLPKLADQLQSTLTSVQQISQTSRVAVQAIDQQIVPNGLELLARLSNVLANLQSLTGELQQNPSMLLRGRQPLQQGPGE